MSNFDFLGSFLGHKANLTKDGHDLSNNEAMSFPFGINVPVTHIPVVPNEHYKIRVANYVQTAPMREDNFATIYNNLSCIFVPMSSICRDYLSVINERGGTDAGNASRSVRIDPAIPQGTFYNFNYRNLVDRLYGLYEGYMFFQTVYAAFPKIYNAYLVNNSGQTAVSPNAVRFVNDDGSYTDILLANIKFKGFFNSLLASNYWSLQDPTDYLIGYVFDAMERFVSPSGENICFDILRLLDNLGMGNIYPFYDYCYHNFSEPELNTSAAGTPGIPGLFSVYLEEHAYAGVSFSRKISQLSGMAGAVQKLPEQLSLMPILAYQYYINLYERSNYRIPSTRVITADSITRYMSSLSSQFSQPGAHLYSFANIPSTWDSEVFAGAVENYFLFLEGKSNLSNISDSLFVYLFSLSNPLLDADLFTTLQSSVVSGSIPTVSSTQLTSNLVQALADTSALYKYKQDLLRAGVRRDKQIESLFGVKGDNNLYESVDILDKASSRLNIQSLINQAESENFPLGMRAARGNGEGYLDVDFNSKDYGFVFVIQSFTCDIYYEAFMIDKHLRKSPQSYFSPEFAHLGLESVYQKDCSMIGKVSSYLEPLDADGIIMGDSVLGCSARDFNLKQRVNKAHGAFTNFGLGANDSTWYTRERKQIGAFLRGNAPFGGFLPTVINQQVNGFQDFKDLYFDPSMLNNIFTDMFYGALASDYQFDHFRNVYNISVHKVSPMPKIGLLKINV